MVDLTAHQAQIRKAMDEVVIAVHDPRAAFLGLLQSAGYTLPKSLMLGGRIDRIDSPNDSRPGKLSGWYWYDEHEIGDEILGVGRFGCWKSGETHTWSSKSLHHMSDKESYQYYEAQRQAKALSDQAEKKRHEDAAVKALEIYNNALTPTGDEGYLIRKGITPCPLLRVTYEKYACGELIVPVICDNKLSSLQFILNEGEYKVKGESIGNKKMMSGGKTKACTMYIPGDNSVVYICEGYATGRSINMATGNTVCVCFTANNIYNAATQVREDYPDSVAIIAGDDDTETKGNPGRTKAEQVAEAMNMQATFSPYGGDFNDMHKDHGLNALADFIRLKNIDDVKQCQQHKEIRHFNDLIKRPSGVLGHIFDYYNTTSGIYQPGYAIQTAIAICSTILARSYMTDQRNYPSLFLLNIGDSATGKEHIKKIIERILDDCGLDHLIGGDGFTSPGGVFTALMRSPKQVSVIDEMGLYLKACKDGDSNSQGAAISILMQAITRCDHVLRPRVYSAMTNKKDDGVGKNIYNPALTLCGNTTPSTFYDVVDVNAIKSGFLNRFFIYISDVEMQVRKDVPDVDVPDRITDWVSTVIERAGGTHTFTEKFKPVVLNFSPEAKRMREEYAEWAIERAKELKGADLEKMALRLAEWAMRLSLVCALSRDPMAEYIEKEDMEWAIYWSKFCFNKSLSSFKTYMVYSEHDKIKGDFLKAIQSYGEKGILFKEMMNTAPFKGTERKRLKSILDEMKEAELITECAPEISGRGRPTTRWVSLI